jgi:hypothetical protein
MLRKKLATGIVGILVGIGISAGIAAAVWTLSGSGSGGGAAAVAKGLTVTAVTPTGSAASLYPGGPAAPVYFQVANPNPFPVTISGVTFGTPTSTNTAACPSSDISVDPSAPTSVSISLPANATAGTTYPISGVLDLAQGAPNGCQGVGFNVPMTLSATQQ